MFMGPFDQAIAWNEQGVKGVGRFLERVWGQVLGIRSKKSSQRILRALNKLNKKVDEDLAAVKLNTVIAAFMEFSNLCQEFSEETGREAMERFLILFSPFAPHLCEELWQKLGHKNSLLLEKWPKYDEGLIKDEQVNLIIQINGKVRDKILAPANLSQAEAEGLTFEQKKVKNLILGKKIKKIVFVPGKLINIVI